ncbi:MAG: virulence factor SrfB [Rhodospirillaceae bacterium]
MLPKPLNLEDDIALVMRSGLQFLDFGLTLDLRKLGAGGFVATGQENCVLERLDYDEAADAYLVPRRPDAPVTGKQQTAKPTLDLPVMQSVALLEDLWLPLPVFRVHGNSRFVEGPTNWARARLVTLRPGEDDEGHTHRLVLSFDTTVDEEDHVGARYLAPTLGDVTGGGKFALAWRAADMHGFCARGEWVWTWLEEVYRENAERRLRMPLEDIEDTVAHHHALAHYLNVLWLIGTSLRGPERHDTKPRPQFSLLSNRKQDSFKPIQVDLVLDVGNSRTVGILIEDHPQEGDGLRDRYVLQLRDLTRPHLVHEDPFESRVEFAEASFGKVNHSVLSGRNAFQWPTIARVGPEATRLAARRRGTEGSTGLSSPKRYLWDEDRYIAGWRFNDAFEKSESEPFATAAPFGDLVDERGEALFTCPDELAVFHPHYSRSSLMTFMLAEVLVQALTQMNSAGQRTKVKQANFPRHLRSVILTVPPSMPKPEREIFEDRVRQAIGLVWKAMGWHRAEAPVTFPDTNGNQTDPEAWPPLPSVVIQWDEATCAQVVWLYSEIINHFGGRPEEFISVARRKRPGDAERRALRVASIDIGGGTTDLVISDYELDAGRGANVYIQPHQKFRDGFKVAGDDIVLEVITSMVLPAIETALKERGVADPGPVVSRMMGAEAVDVQEAVARQQLTLQVLYPMALRILKDYESYDPQAGADVKVVPLGDVFSGDERPSDEVLAYVARCVRQVAGVPDFDLLAVSQHIDLNRLHGMFLNDRMEICKTIKSLCEIVYLYDADWLLLSGRPSRLAGVQALFRALLPLPPDRILPLHEYRTGDWYPFSSQHRIQDPKTTAAVGAMLSMLCAKRRLPNFFFLSGNFKITSTVRNIGLLDRNMTIKDEDVYFRDVDLDDAQYRLPETPFEMRGPMTLGFRQLGAARWGGSPLYRLEFADGDSNRARTALENSAPDGGEATVLNVVLERCKADPRGYDHVRVKEVTTPSGVPVSKSALRIRLLTLNAVGLEENSYWLDTGSIVR